MGDEETRALILAEKDPKEQKRLGRRVSPWDEDKWLEAREDIVYRGNLAKFGQNEELRKALLDTGDSVLVEASPLDEERAKLGGFYHAELVLISEV